MKKNTMIAILVGIMMIASGSTIAPGRGLIGPAQIPDIKLQPIGNPSGLHLDFGSLPLYFIANRGQVDGRALFYAKAARYTLWLTEQGLVFDSFKSERAEAPAAGKEPSLRPEKHEGRGYERDVSRLVFLNASKRPEIVPVAETALKVNYFIGNDPAKWHAAVPTSEAVLYRNVYDRIDLKVYGIESRIEYDWIVSPGGDPRDIRFEYRNVKGTRVDEAGNLLVETGFGELVHKKPAAYQEAVGKFAAEGRSGNGTRAAVESAFKKIGENAYGFEVGAYEAGQELVIDPVVLAYSTYLGGNGNDYSYGIAVDGSGNAYVTGQTNSVDFPTRNQYQKYQEADFKSDVFVTKIDTTKSGGASLVYSTCLGGSSYDYGNGIAVDGSGNAYVTGLTSSADFPTRNQYQTKQAGDDAFVTKIDTMKSGNDSLVYSTYLGGSGNDSGRGIAVDGSGNAYVAGQTNSADFPILNQYQTDQAGDDAFVTKIDTTESGNDSLVYSTYLGGNNIDYGIGIAVDGSGKVYVIGQTLSTDFPILNQYQISQGSWDAFVTKIDTTESGNARLVYSTYLGGSGYDLGFGIAVDGSGNAYVTGQTDSTNFPILNQFQTYQAWNDAFVTKIDTTKSDDASLAYSTYLGGNFGDYGYGIAVDGSGNAYVTGSTNSSDFPILNQYQRDQAWNDAFVTKIDTTKSDDASLVYSTYLGGNNFDCGNGIAVDGSCNAYVTGFTYSTDFPTLNQYQVDQAAMDAFITKISAGNRAPVAIGKDIRRPAGNGCQADAAAEDFDNGSYDPDGDPLIYAISPVGPYSLSDTPVTLTVTDSHGASASCSAKITVYDDNPPSITSLAADPNSLWPANHKMVPISVTVSAIDNCSPIVTSKIVKVTSNEPVDGLGDGDTAPDWLITGPLTLNLRAERAGNGTGRIYTITIECRDAAGNKATGIVTVKVPKSQGK